MSPVLSCKMREGSTDAHAQSPRMRAWSSCCVRWACWACPAGPGTAPTRRLPCSWPRRPTRCRPASRPSCPAGARRAASRRPPPLRTQQQRRMRRPPTLPGWRRSRSTQPSLPQQKTMQPQLRGKSAELSSNCRQREAQGRQQVWECQRHGMLPARSAAASCQRCWRRS
jgi:hypothetical protein